MNSRTFPTNAVKNFDLSKTETRPLFVHFLKVLADSAFELMMRHTA